MQENTQKKIEDGSVNVWVKVGCNGDFSYSETHLVGCDISQLAIICMKLEEALMKAKNLWYQEQQNSDVEVQK